MSVHLSPIGNAFQFFNSNGRPLSLGSLYTYAAGTSTPQTTYSDSAGGVPNANPIVLDASGRVQTEVWLTDGSAYKFVLKDSGGSTIGTYDNISGIGDPLSVVEPIILAALAASSGSSSVGFLQAGTGAVARTVQSRLRDTLSVKDFGAVGNGIADDTAAITNAVAEAVALGSATIFFPAGTYLVSSTISVGDVAGGTFTSINLRGEGVVSTFIKWNGATNGTMMKFWRNKYGIHQGISFLNGVAMGTTTGLLLTGPASGTQTNNHLFDNCQFQAFGTGIQAGGGTLGTEAASELVFNACHFQSNNDGFLGAGSGNTLNITFIMCSAFNNTRYGFNLGTSGAVQFYGGASTANGTATFRCQINWQSNLIIDGFRSELTPPELFMDLSNVAACVLRGVHVVTTAAVPTYDIMIGTPGFLGMYGCAIGQGGDTGWKVFGNDYGDGRFGFLEMAGNTILGTTPFTIGAGSGLDKYRYSLRGNFYNGSWHGVEEGVVVWPNRVDRVVSPRACQYNAIATGTPATLTGAQFSGASDVVINMTAALGGAGTLNTPTAALIVAATPLCNYGLNSAGQNFQYKLRVINSSAGAFAWTVTAGTAVTLNGTMTINQNTWRDFIVTLTNVATGTEAVSIQSVGTGTYS